VDPRSWTTVVFGRSRDIRCESVGHVSYGIV